MSTRNHDQKDDTLTTDPAQPTQMANAGVPLTDAQLDQVSGGHNIEPVLENVLITSFKPRPVQDRD